MTTKVKITNYGPDKVEVEDRIARYILQVNQFLEIYVHSENDLTIREVKNEESKSL